MKLATLNTHFSKLKIALFGPASNYKVGDAVQLREGGEMMIIVEVIRKRGMDQPLLYCQWSDPDNRATRHNLFREESLVHFDWHKASQEIDDAQRQV